MLKPPAAKAFFPQVLFILFILLLRFDFFVLILGFFLAACVAISSLRHIAVDYSRFIWIAMRENRVTRASSAIGFVGTVVTRRRVIPSKRYHVFANLRVKPNISKAALSEIPEGPG